MYGQCKTFGKNNKLTLKVKKVFKKKKDWKCVNMSEGLEKELRKGGFT